MGVFASTFSHTPPARERCCVIFTYRLTDAIMDAAGEGKHDRQGMIQRVMELRPGTTRPSATSWIYALIRKRRLCEGSDGVVCLPGSFE